ncbi:Halomucin [Frankliniella fusca]|uniref:Halomucin n=1 Tax=Frankliniella fusca TaxID=407009 RepID=A0AAE1I0T6_9NEOP|nr:Halomucin [Frankliniella fusca]
MKRWNQNALTPKFNALRKKRKNLKIMYHNIQSLKKHVNLVRNDRNFTSHDILLFGETWLKQNEVVKIHGYKQISQTAASPISKPQGVAIFIKKDLLTSIDTTNSLVLKDKCGRIDVAWIKLKKHTVVAVYAKPKTSLHLWNTFFKKIPLQTNTHTIIMGDVNIDSKNKHLLEKFMPLLQKYKLTLVNRKMITTHNNTALDWIISNIFMKTRGKKKDYKKLAGMSSPKRQEDTVEISSGDDIDFNIDRPIKEEPLSDNSSCTKQNLDKRDDQMPSTSKGPKKPSVTPVKRSQKTNLNELTNSSSDESSSEDNINQKQKKKKLQKKRVIHSSDESSDEESDDVVQKNKGMKQKRQKYKKKTEKDSSSESSNENSDELPKKNKRMKLKNEKYSKKVNTARDSSSESDASSDFLCKKKRKKYEVDSSDTDSSANHETVSKKEGKKPSTSQTKKKIETSSSGSDSTDESMKRSRKNKKSKNQSRKSKLSSDSSDSEKSSKKKKSKKHNSTTDDSDSDEPSSDKFLATLNDNATLTSRDLKLKQRYKLLNIKVTKETGFKGMKYNKAVGTFENPKNSHKKLAVVLPKPIANYDKKILKELTKRIKKGKHPYYVVQKIESKKRPDGAGNYDCVTFKWT